MNSEELSLKSFIEEMKEVTDGFHPRKFCFVLGAGASRSSGIKSGQELVKIWDKELRERNEKEYHKWRKELSITDENMSTFYSQYYEKRFFRCPTDGYNYIEKIMESATPSAGYVMLAHLLTQTPHNVVITTNFDHLTEDSVNYYAQRTPLVIGHETLSHYISGQPVRPTIIKIHRDLLFDPKSRLKDLEKLPDSWKGALSLIFTHYHPVFIGYAGNDKSLMDFLMENVEKFANDEWKYPYWLLYRTDKLEGRIAEFLKCSGGFYIFHDGFDAVMIQLGAAFDYSVPSEDSFLGDARKRYKALVDTIDALSDTSKIGRKAEAVPNDGEVEPSKVMMLPEKTPKAEEDINWAITKITSQSEQQRMYREATSLLDANEYDKAVRILEELIKLDENNARYHKSLGDAFFFLDRDEDSLKEYYNVLELEPPSVDIYWDIAMGHIKNKQIEKAQDILRRAVELNSDSAVDHFLIAGLFRDVDQYEDALSEYYKASALEPDNAVFHKAIASVLVKLGRNEEAIKEAQIAIKNKSNYYSAYEVLSQALRALGRDREADRAQKKATELQEAKGKN